MRRILILFVDGVGLGLDDPDTNPFVAANTPNLTMLMSGHKLVSEQIAFSDNYSSFVPTDACMGVDGIPQSATGQASIMAGVNVPSYIGKHWGPKPTQPERRVSINACSSSFPKEGAPNPINFFEAGWPPLIARIDFAVITSIP